MRILGRQTPGLNSGLVALFSTRGVDEADPILDSLARRAVELDELKQMGATFAYPESLAQCEWVALLALGRARAKIEVTDSADKAIADTRAAQRQALIAKTGRRG